MASIVCWRQPMPCTPGVGLHRHAFSEFFLCLEDIGSQHTPWGVAAMSPGDLFYFPPEQPHTGNGPPGRTGVGLVLYVPTDLLSPTHGGDDEACRILELLAGLMPRTCNRVPLSAAGGKAAADALGALADEVRLARPGYRCAAKLRFQEMLLAILRDEELADVFQRFGGERKELRLENVLRYLETNFQDPITVDQLVAMTRFGHSQFHAIFRKETGCTCTQYLTRLRLQHATHLIRQTDQSMTSIAYDCGFPCLSHFYHVFRTHFGQSPRQVRIAEGPR